MATKHPDSKLQFKIYRKSTYTDTIIPSSSSHPFNTKMAAFHCFVDRLLKIPLSANDYNAELQAIYQIAINTGYNKVEVDQIIKKKNISPVIRR